MWLSRRDAAKSRGGEGGSRCKATMRSFDQAMCTEHLKPSRLIAYPSLIKWLTTSGVSLSLRIGRGSLPSQPALPQAEVALPWRIYELPQPFHPILHVQAIMTIFERLLSTVSAREKLRCGSVTAWQSGDYDD
jgi:hypothetical protein